MDSSPLRSLERAWKLGEKCLLRSTNGNRSRPVDIFSYDLYVLHNVAEDFGIIILSIGYLYRDCPRETKRDYGLLG